MDKNNLRHAVRILQGIEKDFINTGDFNYTTSFDELQEAIKLLREVDSMISASVARETVAEKDKDTIEKQLSEITEAIHTAVSAGKFMTTVDFTLHPCVAEKLNELGYDMSYIVRGHTQIRWIR